MAKQCIICTNDIDNSSEVYYLNKNKKWLTTGYCYDCIDYELKNIWTRYLNNLKNVDCESSLKRIIKNGINGRLDNKIYYASAELNDNEPIKSLKCNNKIFSGELKNAPNDETIQKLTYKLNELMPILENKYSEITNVINIDYLGKLKSIISELSL